MKNLKKLSAIFMLTALFSVSFTSCIDNEVSPLVEDIYAAQADLLAAQANVQDAEAAYLEAQAAHEQAMADYQAAMTAELEANTAWTATKRQQELLLLMAETSEAVAAAEARAAEAALVHEQEMARLMAEIEAAGAVLAAEYAGDYAHAMSNANVCLESMLDAQADLANAELMVEEGSGFSYEYYVALLEADVAQAEAERDALMAAITDLEAYIADPNTNEAMVSQLEEANATLEAQIAAKEIEMQEKYNEIMAVYEENDVRADIVDRYEEALDDLEDAQDDKELHEDNIANLEAQIAAWEAALADYDAAKAALEADVTAAAQAVADAEAALGMVDGNGDDVTFDDYFDVDADGDAIATGGATYDDPTTLQEEYVNTRIENLDAQAAYSAYAAEYAALVASYNAAAVALADAQATYDAASYQADLDAAEAALVTEQSDFDADMQAYLDAKTAFEADPNGSVNSDGPDVHASNFLTGGYDDMDLGEVGIHTDLSGDTYMRVDTWKETSIGSGEYVPASYYPTKYNATDLAIHISDIQADGAAPNTNINVDADVWVWEATGAGPMEMNDGGGNLVNADDHSLTAGEAADADADLRAVFVNVELDDTSVSNLYTFNVETNTLGLDDFSDRPYTMPYLVVADDDASYDTTPDAEGENVLPKDGDWMLTAYAELWNAKKLVAEEQEDLDQGEQALIDAQAEFDKQKDLFENGADNLAMLEAEANAAAAAEAAAQVAVDEAWVELGQEFPEGEAGDTPREPGDGVPTDSLTLNEVEYNAEIALADFMVCDDACLQANIDAAEAQIEEELLYISQTQPIIDAKQAVVDSLQDEYDEYIANEGHLSSLDADLHAEIIALWQEYWLMEAEINALEFEMEMNDDLIDAYDSNNLDDLASDLEDLQEDYAAALDAVEMAEVALAEAQNEEAAAEAYVNYLQGLVDMYEACYESRMAIAAEYKALMEAALAAND